MWLRAKSATVMPPSHPPPGIPPAQTFLTTHWSRVLLASEGDKEQSETALAQLCRDYWYPLYAYARRRGRSPQDAEDATQAFFLHILEGGMLKRADAERGRFRTFLLSGMQKFLAKEYRRDTAEKRGGAEEFVELDGLDAEARFALEPADPITAEAQFERSWAYALIEKVFRRLHGEYVEAGREALFAGIRPFLTAESARPGYEAAAEALGMSANGVGVAVHRMRKRYGELMREEITETVQSENEIDSEIAHLLEVVSRG